VLEIAARMLAKGARVREVQKNLHNMRPISMLKLWGIALERVRRTRAGVVVTVILQRDLKVTGATEEDIAGIVTLLEGIEGCPVALLLCEMPDGTIRGSLRSNGSTVDVARLARLFGGGGHARAAGFLLPGSIRIDKAGWSVV
jgi:phosphoesterase RecJ-like protein